MASSTARQAHLPALRDLGDEDLFEAACAGDPTAFRILMDRHTRFVRKLAYNILGDAQEAEDVAQETFLSAWRGREGWSRGGARFTTWLSRIAINKAIDQRRKRKPIPETDEKVQALADADTSRDFAAGQQARLEEKEASAALKAAMARLPQAQREALMQFYFQDFDVARIAASMDSTEQAVRSLLKRGRQALRNQLQRQKKLCGHGPGRPEGTAGDPRA